MAEQRWSGEGPRPLDGSLARIANNLGGLDVDAFEVITTKWEHIAGPTMAALSRPIKLADGVLVIRVEQPALATQLAVLSSRILGRIAELVTSAPTAIEVRVRAG
jgi:predicted nucleic acid-binding Zn ribbon protein